jgi:putative flavoprotein involved in K+ transport
MNKLAVKNNSLSLDDDSLSSVDSITSHFPVIIIGGGQAGLSVSYCLKQQGIAHHLFEKNRIGHDWRSRRWDSFCLVTPNWQCKLPGFPYSGGDPHGFIPKDEIVKYLEDYAASFDPPVSEGVGVEQLRKNDEGVFEISTRAGNYTADQVVIATGGYHIPSLPRMAERLPADIVQLHSSAYRNPDSLPEGAVLVVGTGQSGCQIAEDLHWAGRQVHLSVGSAPRSPRKYRGKDAIDWLDEMGYYAIPIHAHPKKERVKAQANHYLTGRNGGHEIDLRKFALEGMKLHGRLADIQGATFAFRDDLKANLDNADAVSQSIKNMTSTSRAKRSKHRSSRSINRRGLPPTIRRRSICLRPAFVVWSGPPAIAPISAGWKCRFSMVAANRAISAA